MDLGQKLHMSLDDLIKTRNDVQKKGKVCLGSPQRKTSGDKESAGLGEAFAFIGG